VQVGRDAELALVQAAVSSPPSLVVIDGEAGIGKSRLVRELAESPGLADSRVLVGHCDHLQEPLPLGPLLDVFYHLTDQIVPTDLSPVVGALAPLVPELADRIPSPPPVLSDQRAVRHRVFRAATELLDHLGPTVLVLEDLHWADSGTYDFLTFLASHQPKNLSVVLTARSESGPLPIREALARAPFGPPLSISLRPLGRSEVGELAESILRVEIPDPIASALYEKTGGIPFVVEEVLRTLLERLTADEIPSRFDVLDDLAVPTALRDVVLQRLAALDPVVNEILGVAAVLDLTVDADLLAELTGRSPAQVATALASAQAVGLLQEQDDQCWFRHVLAQQIVYEAVPAPNRRRLHRDIARIIEQRVSPKPVARLAHHYHRAGDMQEFVRNAEDAADLAVSHGDDATAAKFLLQATSVAELPQNARLRLAAKLGRAAVDGLAHTEAVPILERLLATPGLPAGIRGELRFALGRLLRQQGLAQAGYREIERAVPDLEDRPALLARALAVLAAPETVIDRHISAHAARCDQAEQAARRSGSHEVELAVLIARASLLLEQGDPGGWTLIERLRRDDVLLANPREHARACVNWAQGALHVGHVRRAEELLAEGQRVAEKAEYLRIAEVVDLVAAGVDCAAGRWDGLDVRARELAYQPSHFGAASLDGQLLHGTMLAAAGSSSEAVNYLHDLVAAAERVGAIWPLLPARTVLARLLLTMDDAAGSAEQATAALARAREKGNWVWAADPVLCLVDALVALGRTSQVGPLAAELSEHVNHVDAPVAQAALRRCQAIVAREQGHHLEADALLEAARQRLRDAGLRYDEAQASERLGRWRCERDADDGPGTLEDALHIYGELHASRDVARICQTMRQHGIPVPYPWRGGRRSYGRALSSREREVAQLAAAGKTNREIAADLFLSDRTVESHISSALRKLDCRSRRDLAAQLAVTDPDADQRG
jgi:DNA-binding CsgD family transcriptional regulator